MGDRRGYPSHFITSTVIVRNARRGEGVGVQFLDLSPERAERLRAFMAEHFTQNQERSGLRR